MISRIRKAMDERDQGFTLIELLVVIIIIGILAAIAIPVFLNQRKKGVDAGIKSDLKNAAVVVETWATDSPGIAVLPGSSSNGVIGNGSLSTFKSSPNNTVTLVANTTAGRVGAYCLFGYNAGASTATTSASMLKYDSYAGGIQSTNATTTACA